MHRVALVGFGIFDDGGGGGRAGGGIGGGGDIFCWCCCCFWESFSYKGFTFFKYLRMTSLALELTRFTAVAPDNAGAGFLCSLRKTDENFGREKYLDDFLEWKLNGLRFLVMEVSRLNSSSATELGREESQSWWWRRSVEEESEEWEAVESREAVVVVSEEEEVEGEERRRVRTMERRGERCKGRSWPL